MNPVAVETALENALDGVRLLEHPFYQRWERGEISRQELADYASQYRHFEAALPTVLKGIIDSLPEGKARDFVQANYDDETAAPSHLQLFDEFVDVAGGSHDAAPSPAITALLNTYARVGARSSAAAIGGLTAYEMQAPGVASTKGEGLRCHYNFDAEGTKFWDIHAELDIEHRQWAMDAIVELGGDIDEVTAATREVAEAWWKFLDERETLATAA